MLINPKTNKNLANLKGEDISQDLALLCFTEEQRSILSFKQGEIDITVEHQINHFYGSKLLTWDKPTTLRMFAYMVEEHSYLIEEIAKRKSLIALIKDPINYRQIAETKNQFSNTSKTKLESQTMDRTTHIRDNSSENDAVSASRTVESKTDKVIEGASLPDDYKALNLTYIQREDVKFITNPQEHPESLLSTRRSVLPDEIKPGVDNLDYHHTLLVKDGSRSRSIARDTMDIRGLNHNTTNNLGALCGGSMSTNLRYVEADTTYQSLMKDIPRLRSRFWNKFNCLFADIDACIYLA